MIDSDHIWFLLGDGNWKYTKIDRAHSVGFASCMTYNVLLIVHSISSAVMLSAGHQQLIQVP